MMGERNGISITAIPEKEVDEMRSKIQDLRGEIEGLKEKLKESDEEAIVLRMNND